MEFYVDKYIVKSESYTLEKVNIIDERKFGCLEDAVNFAKKNHKGSIVCRVYQIREVIWS